jgi:RNA recognition motif-containing protein
VSNLPPGFRLWDLEDLFGPFGPLLMWDVPRFPGDMCGCRTENRMSFGYVVFKKREDGERAIGELNGYEALGHKLRVDWVYPSCV